MDQNEKFKKQMDFISPGNKAKTKRKSSKQGIFFCNRGTF